MPEIKPQVRHYDPKHAVYTRGDDVAVVHRLSLQKLYLRRSDWEGHEAEHLATFRPFELVKPPTKPRVLQAVLTQACNYRCGYCTVFNNPQPTAGQGMTAEVVDQVAATFNERFRAENGLLILHGGEPLLRVVDDRVVGDELLLFFGQGHGFSVRGRRRLASRAAAA